MGVNGSFSEDDSTFLPIPDLQPPMADITLLFLSANDIAFAEPSDDSWYSAHVPFAMMTDGFSGNMSVYLRDDPVRVLGCSLQHQYCNPSLKPDIRCTPLTAHDPVYELAESLWQTTKQKALFNWFGTAIRQGVSHIPRIVEDLGVSSLTSRYKLSQGMQGPLPTNQWQLDVQNWFLTMLAHLQSAMVETATGPIDADVTQWLERPQTSEARLACRSQVGNLPRLLCDDLLILCLV